MKGSREENRKNFKLSDVLPRNNRKVIRFVNFCWDEKQSVSLPQRQIKEEEKRDGNDWND